MKKDPPMNTIMIVNNSACGSARKLLLEGRRVAR